MKRYTPTLGSISSGTLRTEEILDTFLDELCAVAPRKHGALKREARRELAKHASDDDYDDTSSEIVNDLQEALNEHAPPFVYFGAHYDDGADFGWWPVWHAIDDLDEFEDTGKAAADRFVGEFKVISDHGNVEVYIRFANGRIKSLLGFV